MTANRLNIWVAIAEIISAGAVVISLIYVGLEINQSTLESEADIQAELLSYTTRRRYLVIESSDLSSILHKGYTDASQLSPSEMLRFQGYVELLYVAWERLYMSYDAGVLSEGLFVEWNRWFISVAARDPAFVWPMVRDSQGWGSIFVQHVDASLGYPKPDQLPD
ncbi:hypothetical protein [Congregibacter sp.]|uniref:hypothetical protein n=1 Tax=Congregibacter sp. TaxID=2744308 RepID=UPI00385D5B3F